MTNFIKHKMRGKSPAKIFGIIIFGIFAIGGLATLFGFIVMWLWNWLMPEIFGLTTLTYWQAVGVFILFKILLGGIGNSSSKSEKKSNKSRFSCNNDSKGDFSKWKFYDAFWKEEGQEAYEKYIEKINNPNSGRATDVN